MLLPSSRAIHLTILVATVVAVAVIPLASAFLPILGDIARDTIGTIGQIGKKIHTRLNDQRREKALNPVEKLGVVKDALIEDYVENHDKRLNRVCEYLRRGKLYRGPCLEDGRGQQGGPEGGGYTRPGAVVKEEEITIIENPRGGGGGGRRGGGGGGRGHRGRGPHHRPDQVEEITIIENPRGGGGGGRGHRGRGPHRRPDQVEEITIIEKPRGGGGGRGHRGRGPQRRPEQVEEITVIEKPARKPVIEDEGTHRVQPETVVEEEEDSRPRPPPSNHNGRGKSERQQQQPGQSLCRTSEGLEGMCMPPSYCYSQYSGIDDYRQNLCQLGGGRPGVCCPQRGQTTVDKFELVIHIPIVTQPLSKIRFVSLEDINTAAKDADRFIQKFVQEETELIRKGMVQRRGTSQSLHQSFFGEFDPVQFRLTKGGFLNLISTMMIMKKFNLKKTDARDGLKKYSIENTDLERFCLPEPSCHQSKYRTFDGSCNNLQRPLWGKSNTAYERLLQPEYEDGLHEPRTKSVAGSQLPSARVVSFSLAQAVNSPDPKHTLMVMQWGQFLDHDLTLTASTRAATGQGLVCCDDRTQNPINHHACFPIIMTNNDPFYARFNQRCMHFVRSSPATVNGCSLGPREQMNALTHLMDASMIYGSSVERTKQLREFRGGKLKNSFIDNLQFLPFEQGNQSDCAFNQQEQRQFKCFVAGDARVNEQSGLTMMHNLWLREHNRVADILKTINKRWDDETLFQEARRIVIAEVQHITYNEFFPVILGHAAMNKFDLLPKTFGQTTEYRPKVNPNILNEFAAAAYRLHSLVQGVFTLRDNNGQVTHRLQLHTLFNKPKSMFLPNAFDQYLNGFSIEPAQAWDHFFAEELTNKLFSGSAGFGLDLVSLNIQRGRDHGLPGYNAYRRVCGMRPLQSFADLDVVMTEGASRQFSQIYRHVDDIDLFIAGSYEKPLQDGLVGPVFACIIAEQARRSKLGDRFWYEHGRLPHSFSPEQLNQIRQVSLASLICENGDTIRHIQPLVFIRPEGWNKRVHCDQITKLNLNFWKNERIW